MNEPSSMLIQEMVSSGNVIKPQASTSRGENESPPTEQQPRKKTGFYKRCTKFEKRMIAQNYCEMRGIEGLSKHKRIMLTKKLAAEGYFPKKWVEFTKEQTEMKAANNSMVPGGSADSKDEACGSSVKQDFKEGSRLPNMTEQPLPGVQVSKWKNKTFLRKHISKLRREGIFPRCLLKAKGDESSLLPGESGKTKSSYEGYSKKEKRKLARQFCSRNGLLYSDGIKYLDKRIRRLESTGYFKKMFTKMKKLKLSYDSLSPTKNVPVEPKSKLTVSTEPYGTTESKSSGDCLDDVTSNLDGALPGCDRLGDPEVSDSGASSKAVIRDPLEQEKSVDCQNYDSNLQRPERPSVDWRSREQPTERHSSFETKMTEELKNTFGSRDHRPGIFNHSNDWSIYSSAPERSETPRNSSTSGWSSQSEGNEAQGSHHGSSTFQRDDFQFKKPNPQHSRIPGNDSRSDWSSQSKDNKARGSQYGNSSFQRDDFEFKKPNPQYSRRPGSDSRSDWSCQSEDNKARGSHHGNSSFQRDNLQFKKPNPQHSRRPGSDSRSDWSEDNKARGSHHGNFAFQRDDFQFKKPNPQNSRRSENDYRSDWPSQSGDNKARGSHHGNFAFQRDDLQFKKPNPQNSRRSGSGSRSDWSSQSEDNKANQGNHYGISTFSRDEFLSRKRNYQGTRMPGNASLDAISTQRYELNPSMTYSEEETFTRPPSITPGPSQSYRLDDWERDDQYGKRKFQSDSHVFPSSNNYNQVVAVRKPVVNERYRLRYLNDSQQVDNERVKQHYRHKQKSEEPERRPYFDSRSGTIADSRKIDSYSHRSDPPLQNRWDNTAADDYFGRDKIPSVMHRLGPKIPENTFSPTSSPKRQNMRRYDRSTENRSVDFEKTCYMAVVPRDYPDQRLTTREMAMVRNALLELRASNVGLRFDGTFEDRGAIFFGCKDQFTVDWLRNAIQNLKPWRGAQLKLSS